MLTPGRLMVDMAVKLGVRSASLSGSGTENASHASQHKDALSRVSGDLQRACWKSGFLVG